MAADRQRPGDEVVDRDDSVSLGQKTFAEVRTDKPRPADITADVKAHMYEPGYANYS